MRDRRQASGPVADPDALPRDVNREAIAAPFHLEGPIVSSRRFTLELREAKLDPLRHRGDKDIALRALVTRRSLDGVNTRSGPKEPDARIYRNYTTQRVANGW